MEILDETHIGKTRTVSRIADSGYVNAGYWFFSFLILSALAFYPRYLGVWSLAIPPIVHAHAVLMTLWMVMLVIQPMLIKRKNFRLHHRIGRLSYLLVALIVIATYGMIRHAYDTYVGDLREQVAQGTLPYAEADILYRARMIISLPLVYTIWFVILYALAIIYRKTPFAHAQYIIAASLTLLGPTVDRIIYSLTGMSHFGIVPIEAVSFMMAVIVLLFLVWYDVRKNFSFRPALISLAIFLTGTIAYFTIQQTAAYQSFVRLILY
ncbi:MAG TPA: hypothetical protein VEB86_06970 [Chryseosolibacter sp.]|nr:hypothetical protein [Chryseosolibacter sp.]